MATKLTQAFIDNVEQDGYFFDAKIEGLCFRKRGPSCSWYFRRTINGRRREVGIGSTKRLSLVQARAEATRLKALTDEEFLQRFEKKEKHQPVDSLTFSDVASKFEDWNLEVGKWQELDKGHRVYRSRMKNHVLPFIGNLEINSITCDNIAELAKRIHDKPDTVERVVQLIKRIFDWAKAKRYFSHDNPADKSGALKFLLPPGKHIPRNRGALSVKELPAFMKELHDNFAGSNANRCAFFAILTATRSQTAREAKWSQIDFENRIWDIPPSQLKMSENGALIVPLADEVIEFLRQIPKTNDRDLIFPNPKGDVMTDTAFSNVVKDLPSKWIDCEQTRSREKEVRATPHGIARATFRTWAQDDELGNDQRFSDRVAELCLHHKPQDGYNGAYERNKSFIRRREMMDAWAKYCFSLIKQY